MFNFMLLPHQMMWSTFQFWQRFATTYMETAQRLMEDSADDTGDLAGGALAGTGTAARTGRRAARGEAVTAPDSMPV